MSKIIQKMNVYLITKDKVQLLNKDGNWFHNIFLPAINQQNLIVTPKLDEYWNTIKNVILGKTKSNNLKVKYYNDIKFISFNYNNQVLAFVIGNEKSESLKNIYSISLFSEDNLKKFIFLDEKIIKPEDITEELIKNINNISYKGLTNSQSKLLNSVVKETLREVKKDNSNRELAMVYDLNGYINQYGQWLFKIEGENDTDYIKLESSSDVAHLLKDKEINRAIVISHNHPNNRIISLQDIKTFCTSPNIKIIVAVTNSGKISYIVKENFDFDKYMKISQEVIDSCPKFPEDVNKENDAFLMLLLNRCQECGLYFYKEG